MYCYMKHKKYLHKTDYYQTESKIYTLTKYTKVNK